MATLHHPVNVYPVRTMAPGRPLAWLREGWQDLLHQPGPSLAYGWLVSSLGALIIAYNQHPFYIAAVASGFLLVGPIFTAGLCELSRRREQGEPTDFQSSLEPIQRNRSGLLMFAGGLLLLAVVWFTTSAAMMAGLFGSVAPSLESTIWGDVLRQSELRQLGGYVVAGGVLAGVVFSLSVVSVPMIIDRHVDAGTAMRTSLRVAGRDLPVMMVWATLIVGLVAVGFATWLLGMVIIFPLLGHATWRAYRDLVE